MELYQGIIKHEIKSSLLIRNYAPKVSQVSEIDVSFTVMVFLEYCR